MLKNGKSMKKRLLVNPYALMAKRKEKDKTSKSEYKIDWTKKEPETIWPRSDFKEAFDIDPRAWDPVFFRK